MAIKIKDNKIFEGINSTFINLLIDNSRRIEVKALDVIITQGELSNNQAFIIQEGNVIVEINGIKIKELGEGEMFGEIGLITNEPRTATIKAKSDLILLRINKIILDKIIKELKNGKEIQKIIFDRIMENNKK